jgi:hypothetical protein
VSLGKFHSSCQSQEGSIDILLWAETMLVGGVDILQGRFQTCSEDLCNPPVPYAVDRYWAEVGRAGRRLMGLGDG